MRGDRRVPAAGTLDHVRDHREVFLRVRKAEPTCLFRSAPEERKQLVGTSFSCPPSCCWAASWYRLRPSSGTSPSVFAPTPRVMAWSLAPHLVLASPRSSFASFARHTGRLG